MARPGDAAAVAAPRIRSGPAAGNAARPWRSLRFGTAPGPIPPPAAPRQGRNAHAMTPARLLATTALGLGLAWGLPAGAQMTETPGAGTRPMPGSQVPGSQAPGQQAPGGRDTLPMARGAGTTAGPGAVRDHARETMPATGTAPAQGGMAAAARRADQAQAGRDPARLLDEAARALRGGNWAMATEMAERAQTSLLNAHVQSGGDTDALRAAGRATAALQSRNRAEAQGALEEARGAATRTAQQDPARPGMAQPGMGAAPVPGSAMGSPGMDERERMRNAPGMGAGATTLPQPGMGGGPGAAQPERLGPPPGPGGMQEPMRQPGPR